MIFIVKRGYMSSSMFNFKSSGFKTTDRRFESKKTVVRPIGIKTPLSEGEDVFEMNSNPVRQIADNFRNLILTNAGERLGRFNYGANLKALVFEYSNNPNFVQIVTEEIIDKTKKHIPAIQILDVEPIILDKHEKDDLNQLGLTRVIIKIEYLIPKFKSPKMGLEVSLTVGG